MKLMELTITEKLNSCVTFFKSFTDDSLVQQITNNNSVIHHNKPLNFNTYIVTYVETDVLTEFKKPNKISKRFVPYSTFILFC